MVRLENIDCVTKRPANELPSPSFDDQGNDFVLPNTFGLAGAGVAFFTTIALLKLLVPIAKRLDLMDHPVGRKDHSEPTPVIGGIAMLVGILTASVVALQTLDASILGFLAAGTLLVVVGILDDKFDLAWWWRVLVQIVAALIMIHAGGIRVHYLGHLFGYDNIFLGSLSVPFTVFATVGIINAVNMIDGVDGLAGLLVATALAMLGAAAVYSGNLPIFALAMIAFGAVTGFLVYNIRHPWQKRARSFMGNAGSAFLGLTVAWIAFRLTQTPNHPVTPLLALWVIPIPIMDCLVLIVRRLKQGQSPFSADRYHIHHLMIDAGFTPTRAAFALAAFSCACGLAIAMALRAHYSHDILLGAFFVMCAGWYWLSAKRIRAIAFFGGQRDGESSASVGAHRTATAPTKDGKI